MRTLLLALSSAACLLLANAAHADACFPACRDGFVCAPSGTCVSACNPPCAAGEACTAGQCAVPEEREPAPEKAREHSWFALTIGPSVAGTAGVNVSGLLAVGGELNAQLRIPVAKHVHALVVGARGDVAVSTAHGGTAIVLANLDLGYRASFGAGPVTGGGFVAFSPGVWAGGRDGFAAFGGTLGGFVRFGYFELQLPVTVAYLTDLGSNPKQGTGIRASVLGGVAF